MTAERLAILTAIVAAPVLFVAAVRVSRALATLRARALTPMMSRRLSTLVRGRPYEERELLGADGAGEPWITRRRTGLDRLAARVRAQNTESTRWAESIRETFSDLRFTDASRVPFPFLAVMRAKFNLCSVVTESRGPRLKNLDGDWTIDVSGSYGLNVAGFDRYKEWIEKGWERVKALGPVLGPLHPVVAQNIAMLRRVSRKDEVSFHMSGTEAVMAAVRLVRSTPGKAAPSVSPAPITAGGTVCSPTGQRAPV